MDDRRARMIAILNSPPHDLLALDEGHKRRIAADLALCRTPHTALGRGLARVALAIDGVARRL